MDLQQLAGIRGYLIDLDGTFYLDAQLLPGAKDLIRILQERGLDFLFLTNNSSRQRRHYAEKIRELGSDIPDERVFTSGEATILHLSERHPGAKLYLVGTPDLEEEFKEDGFRLVEHDPQVVVLGFDTTLTYEKLWRLCDFVRAGMPYVATHHDLNCPTQGGFMPDIGATIAFVKASTGRRPDVIVGKPHRPMVKAIQTKTGLPPEALAMVGDRLYTDIAFSEQGLTTILVLSGETKMEDLRSSPFKPDLIVRDLQELSEILRDLPMGRGLGPPENMP